MALKSPNMQRRHWSSETAESSGGALLAAGTTGSGMATSPSAGHPSSPGCGRRAERAPARTGLA